MLVTAAPVQDNTGGQALIRHLTAVQPDVTRILAGAGDKRAVAGEGAPHGRQVEVPTKPAG